MIINSKYLSTFSPTHHQAIFATKAKLFDDTFSSSSEILAYDIRKDTFGPIFNVSHKFNRIIWTDDDYIVCACENGVIEVYKVVLKEYNNTKDEDTTETTQNSNAADKKNNGGDVYCLENIYSNSFLLHTDILGLDYNSAKGLVVCGSSKSKLILLNINDVNNFKAYSTGIMSDLGDIQCVSWNPNVSNILGVGNSAGDLIILDLKQKKELMRIGMNNNVVGTGVSCVKWCSEKSTRVYVVCSGVVSVIELSTNDIKRICDDVISVHFLNDHKNIGNGKVNESVKTTLSDINNSLRNIGLVCAGKTSIKIYDLKYVLISTINFESPIFDFNINNSYASISYLNNKTEIVKTKNLLLRGGIFLGNRSFKSMYSFVGHRIFHSNKDVYNIKFKDNIELDDSKNMSDFFDNLKLNDSFDLKLVDYIYNQKLNDKNIINTLKNKFNFSLDKNGSIKIDENDRILMEIIENNYKFDESKEQCSVPLSIFHSFINKNYKSIDFSHIKENKIIFLISKVTGRYEYLIENIDINHWNILCLHLLTINNFKNHSDSNIDSINDTVISNNRVNILLEKFGDRFNDITPRNDNIDIITMIIYILSGNIEKYLKIRNKQYLKDIEEIKLGDIRQKINNYKNIINMSIKHNIDVEGKLINEYVKLMIFKECYINLDKIVGKNDIEGSAYLELRRINNNEPSNLDNNINKVTNAKSTVKESFDNIANHSITNSANNSINHNVSINNNMVNKLNNESNVVPKRTYGQKLREMGGISNQNSNKNISLGATNTIRQNFNNPIPQPRININTNNGNDSTSTIKHNQTIVPPPNIKNSNNASFNNIPMPNRNNVSIPNISCNTHIPAPNNSNNTTSTSNSSIPNINKIHTPIHASIPRPNNINAVPRPNNINAVPRPNNTNSVPRPDNTNNTPIYSSNTPTINTDMNNNNASNINSNIAIPEEKNKLIYSIQNNINNMISIAKQKQGILFRPILNNALKKIEIYYQYDKSKINMQFFTRIENIFALVNTNNRNKSEIFREIKNEGVKIINENGDVENIDIMVQGFVGIVQVVLGER